MLLPARARCGRHAVERIRIDAERVRRRSQPQRRAFGAERERRDEALGTARFEQAAGLGEERLRKQEACRRSDRRQAARQARREERDRDAEGTEQARELVLDDVGQRADDHQRRLRVGRLLRQVRNQRRKACVLALRERGLDAAAGIVKNLYAWKIGLRQALGRA